MKTFHSMMMALGMAVAVSYPASAQGIGVSTGETGTGISMDGGDKAEPKKKKKKSKKKATATVSKVGKALSKLKTFNGKASKKALVYVYLQSASWCGPCNQEMPGVAKTYKEMKKDGRAEIILIGGDQTEDAAKKFLKKYKAKFPGILATAVNAAELPGFTSALGIPHATMVDGEGNVLADGFPSEVLSGWEQAVENLEGAADTAADSEE